MISHKNKCTKKRRIPFQNYTGLPNLYNHLKSGIAYESIGELLLFYADRFKRKQNKISGCFTL